jgi:hypothetical protein
MMFLSGFLGASLLEVSAPEVSDLISPAKVSHPVKVLDDLWGSLIAKAFYDFAKGSFLTFGGSSHEVTTLDELKARTKTLRKDLESFEQVLSNPMLSIDDKSSSVQNIGSSLGSSGTSSGDTTKTSELPGGLGSLTQNSITKSATILPLPDMSKPQGSTGTLSSSNTSGSTLNAPLANGLPNSAPLTLPVMGANSIPPLPAAPISMSTPITDLSAPGPTKSTVVIPDAPAISSTVNSSAVLVPLPSAVPPVTPIGSAAIVPAPLSTTPAGLSV